MKIGVAGTGAVGGYFGGQLQRTDHKVLFLARNRTLEKLKESGLTVNGDAASFHIDGDFTGRYEDFSDVDLLLFCVKANATKEVAEQFIPFLKNDCLILTLQNGVDNEEILAELFGQQRVFAAATYIQAEVTEPGVIRQIGLHPRLVIGALEKKTSENAKNLANLFNDAGIQTIFSTNVLETKWKKLFWNIAFNPLTALTETKVGAIYESEELYTIAVKTCKEAIVVARKIGIPIEENFYEKIIEQGKLAVHHQTSMLQDKLKGKPLELESICGYVIRKGKELGVATPVLETVYNLLSYQSKIERKT